MNPAGVTKKEVQDESSLSVLDFFLCVALPVAGEGSTLCQFRVFSLLIAVAQVVVVTAASLLRTTALIGVRTVVLAGLRLLVLASQQALDVDELGLLDELTAGEVVLLCLVGQEADVQRLQVSAPPFWHSQVR